MIKDFGKIDCQEIQLPVLRNKGISLFMARLDKLHPIISGNKLYKLHYFIEETLQKRHKALLTFGGAYSNHLVATAFACKQYNLKCTGIVRGERPEMLSPTLIDCIEYGMELIFVPRKEYTGYRIHNNLLNEENDRFTIVPEGGFSFTGAKGASLIFDAIQPIQATHICSAVGTATTIAGLLLKANPLQQIIAVPVLKNMQDIPERLKQLTGKPGFSNLSVWDQFHFGGYAKKTGELLRFMNTFYTETSIPLDFVYTGKLMYAIIKNIENNYFKKGSRIVCLHTGGLQGNRSLPDGSLIYN